MSGSTNGEEVNTWEDGSEKNKTDGASTKSGPGVFVEFFKEMTNRDMLKSIM